MLKLYINNSNNLNNKMELSKIGKKWTSDKNALLIEEIKNSIKT